MGFTAWINLFLGLVGFAFYFQFSHLFYLIFGIVWTLIGLFCVLDHYTDKETVQTKFGEAKND